MIDVIRACLETAPSYMSMEDSVRALDEVFKAGLIGREEIRTINRMRQTLIHLQDLLRESA